MTVLLKKEAETTQNQEITWIKTETIMPNRAQPRTVFETESLSTLAESIRTYGILQPLTVRKNPEKSKFSIFQYELVAGERRLRAAKLLEMEKVPCIIIESDTKTSAALAIIENLHRCNLNVFEEAAAIASLIEIYNLTQEQVAAKLSLTQAAIANKLRILKLTEEEKELILENNLTERHARALLKIKDIQQRLSALQHIIKYSFNVKQSEDYIEQLMSPQSDDEVHKSPERVRSINYKELLSSIKRAIELTRNGGIRVKTQQTETDSDIIYTISIPKETQTPEIA